MKTTKKSISNSPLIGMYHENDLVLASWRMREVLSFINKVARSDDTIILEGESGVGKDTLAHYIHYKSRRATTPFIPVNCGAIPETLFEAEFFGFERGSFTNAFSSHKGYFEQADTGTILLDEVTEIPLHLQVKLLRVLEDKTIARIGSERRIPIDVRVIATTTRNLRAFTQENRFRKDLYYRLAVIVVSVPPLAKRLEDIQPLAEYFLRKNGSSGKTFSSEAISILQKYSWPGNVRELESCIKRAIHSSNENELIEPEDIYLDPLKSENDSVSCHTTEITLRETGGNIKKASMLLGIHRNTLYARLRKHGIVLRDIRNSIKRNGDANSNAVSE